MTLLGTPPSAARTQAASAASVAGRSQRVVSLDAFRGFDMFWIIGGEGIVEAWSKTSGSSLAHFAARQIEHSPWAGLTPYDLIFPTFVFIVGASLVFSLTKQIAVGGRPAAMRRVIVRGVVLYLLGIAYYGIVTKSGHPQLRLMGVLQRIAIAYTCAGVMFCCLKPRTIAIVGVTILLGYWVLLRFVPAPGVGHPTFNEGQNWTNWIDAHYLPGYKWDGNHDPEGLISNFPAVVTCLLGVFAGLLLKNGGVSPYRKVGLLLGCGAAGVAIGYLWGLPSPIEFPVIKKLWTSSFVLMAGGFSAIGLGLFYLVVDVWRLQLWARPFVWIGMNAITLYLLWRFVDFRQIVTEVLSAHYVANAAAYPWGGLIAALLSVALILGVARFLYKRQIFLRV
jgi:predicted acyltransferase